MIHTFDGTHATVERRFWELVASLSMIRHENIVLFMGASMAPPNLAIVTGVRRGMSLHQHTSSRGSIPYPSRVNIARQVSPPPQLPRPRTPTHCHLMILSRLAVYNSTTL